MKKVLILLLCVTVFTNCKTDAKQVETTTIDADGVDRSQAKDGLTTLSGEFSFYGDAAVLQVGNSSIYGVVINNKSKELNKMSEPFKEEATDGVLVQVRGKLIPKKEGEEAWPYSIDIKEIISVKKQDAKKEVIKIGK
ncbi:hypothetical protein [Lacinutrix sp. MedPE-SW]|uniref:hypothetical protein n=1 Tax=Lacinutrix sp. MedPE-SW TaxID=1860087 RepID=UPI0009168C69|nr:hypothetical protein [Lacinutrix sp. MedPE-SW]OIQ23638.1 MAG: hypothetical protein BM549_03475 [Lacinutrix sp. MedPE-SW]